MKRTTVFADEDDLASLREAARHLGVAEAVLLREAVHRAAMAVRRWDEPFFTPAPRGGTDHPADRVDVLDAIEDERASQVSAYEETKGERRHR